MAAHLEECKYFDHCVPSQQFSYNNCFIVQPDNQAGSSNVCDDNEIGLEYSAGQVESEGDEIILECQLSEEGVTDSDPETLTTDSEEELPEEEN